MLISVIYSKKQKFRIILASTICLVIISYSKLTFSSWRAASSKSRLTDARTRLVSCELESVRGLFHKFFSEFFPLLQQMKLDHSEKLINNN